MGFSPGEFLAEDSINEKYHWEGKDNYLVLWNEYETKQLLRLSYEEAKKAYYQLETVLATMGQL